MKKTILFLSVLMIVGLIWKTNVISMGSTLAQDHIKLPNATMRIVPTINGNVAIWDSQSSGPPVIFIHGNSSSGKIFKKQFQEFGKNYRLIAIDLPGHGESELPTDISNITYPGLAQLIAEIIEKLDIEKTAVVGWSLGGRIAFELSHIIPNKIQGMLVTGTAPIAVSQGIKKGFTPTIIPFTHFEPSPISEVLGYKKQFTKDQGREFMGLAGFNVDSPEASFIIDDAVKTDGFVRHHLIESFNKGQATDNLDIVRNMRHPLAMVVGEKDRGVNLDYLTNQVNYGNLWKNKVHTISNANHAAFWSDSQEFNSILKVFLKDIYHSLTV